MNKKNLILISKACLLLSVLGFCIPVFDEANGFAALIYFLGAGEGALYTLIGVALIFSFLVIAASIVFSSLYFIRGKKDKYTSVAGAIDCLLMGLIIVSTLFAFIDAFRVFAIASLVIIPFLLLLKNIKKEEH